MPVYESNCSMCHRPHRSNTKIFKLHHNFLGYQSRELKNSKTDRTVYRIELPGTRLDDYGYVMAKTKVGAHRKAAAALRKLNGKGSVLPEIILTPVTSGQMVSDIRGSRDGQHSLFVARTDLSMGQPVWDFNDWKAIEK